MFAAGILLIVAGLGLTQLTFWAAPKDGLSRRQFGRMRWLSVLNAIISIVGVVVVICTSN